MNNSLLTFIIVLSVILFLSLLIAFWPTEDKIELKQPQKEKIQFNLKTEPFTRLSDIR